MESRRKLERELCNTARRFGYSEIATPTFEHADLFITKSGQEIVEQLYMFKDKGDRELVLRPELTAPVIRFYANDLYKEPKPLKLFYQGSCFRYERPQKGRFREFWQFGAELIGTNAPEGIAELIGFASACMVSAKIANFELRVGNIEILKELLNSWKISPELQAELMIFIDKADIDSIQSILEKEGVSETQVAIFSDMVSYKFPVSDFEERFQILIKQLPMIEQTLARLKTVVELLKVFGKDDLTVDLGIARGIDYYTGIVFEIDVPALGAEKQVCGGGEYSLDEMFNLKDVFCSGFAMGFDRLVMAQEMEGIKPPAAGLDVYIIPLSLPALKKAIEMSTELRNAGLMVELDIKGRNMSKNLKFASSRRARYVVFIGDDELKTNKALIREMDSGDQNSVIFEELADYFQNKKE
jgi:histidyl-tRNA synthetase